jgi:hypothetical protein
MNRQLLEKPFETTQIKQRKGRNGLLDYVEGHSVIQRLNDAFAGAWSFEVVHHEIREEEVLVLGRLSADGISKMAFGGSQVTRERESGKAVSLGDDLKAAQTDCMKKCATFLGVGLHLYAEKPIGGRGPAPRGGAPMAPRAAPPAPPRPAPAPPAGSPPPGKAPVNGSRPVPGPAHSPGPTAGASARQLEAIHKIARAKGFDGQAVEHMALRVFNRKLDALTGSEAAGLLKELSNLKRRVA